jgi:hypothetical protein
MSAKRRTGGDGLDERAHLLSIRRRGRFALPAQDGAGGDAEHPSGLVGGEGEKGPDPQDPEAVLRGVEGPLALGELVPAVAEDLDGFLEEADVECCLSLLGEAVEHRIAVVAVLPQALGEGESEEVGGLGEGLQRELVEAAPLHGGDQETIHVGGRHRLISLLGSR